MARKLIIETQANTESIDKAVQKLGELKDLGKGIKIQYDVDNKPLQVLVDNTLNASQKVKILTAELRKTKEGTVEFGLLNSKLKESQDDLTRINAKSRDLFASFSLIPSAVRNNLNIHLTQMDIKVGPLVVMFHKLNVRNC